MEFNKVFVRTGEIAGTLTDGVMRMLDEFNDALPTMRALGFGVEDIRINMGLLPEITAKLVADASSVDIAAIDVMIEKNSGQKTLVLLLKALQTACNVRNQLDDLGLRGVEINVTLGITPRISVGFYKRVVLPSAPAAVVAS